MKVDVLTLNNTNVGKKDLPAQFSELVRHDLVKRAVEVVQSHGRQPYGAKPRAGMRAVVGVSRRRRDYKTSYGIGISRVPRKIMSHQGTRFNWVGAFAPGTVGGRRSHPPKAYAIWDKKINKKERRKAIRSAMAATMVKALVEQRGHRVPAHYPFIVESKLETLDKTRDVVQALEKLGLTQELERAAVRHVRAGLGKNRGRPYQHRKGPLVVVSGECPLLLRVQNIPGVDVVRVDQLNAHILAPGADIGRLTIFSEAAIERLAAERLYMNDYHGKAPSKAETPSKQTSKPLPKTRETKAPEAKAKATSAKPKATPKKS
ncbi:50S ribosomal protein L4 [Candidatus Woesearchaeota archaeon]|nr:50S ribosomal protein L4 [Candidatus Woesearchaeota archaeon]